MPEDDLNENGKLAFDYAWNWFDFHGKQRMQLFNYFLIITGILATAYVTALDKKFYEVAVVVCVLGIIQSIGFIVFDVRNRDLTNRAEKALHAIERQNKLFDGYLYEKQPIELCLPKTYSANILLEMRFGIWIIEGLIGLLFCAGMSYSFALFHSHWIILTIISIIATLLTPFLLSLLLNKFLKKVASK